MISQLHQLLPGLIPGGAKKALSAAQARTLLATIRPRDPAGQARRRVAAELISDLERIYQRKKAADKELRDLLKSTGTTLNSLNGIGPSGAARLLVEAGDPARFPDKAHFASWNGTAPIDASSGDQVRHRLSRAGNRQINRTPAHHGCRPAPPPRQRGTRLLRPQSRRRENTDGSDALPQTQTLRHRLPPDDPRRPGEGSGPGRTPGGGCWLQRGRLAPRCRHFGEVTSRTRHQRAYPSQAGPFFRSFPRPGPTPDRSRCQAPLCALPSGQVEAALGYLGCHAGVLTLDPRTLEEVLDSILAVGRATGVPGRAGRLVAGLRARLAAVAARVAGRSRPKVAAIEWLDPPFTAGQWVPGLVTAAGGTPVAACPGKPSVPTSWAEIAAAAPDLVVVAPCGYHLAGAAGQAPIAARALPGLPIWAIDADGITSAPVPAG
jgi:hypothetical protein